MAITQLSAPTEPTLAYQPNVFRFSSSSTDIVNLIIEVFISYDGGINADRVAAISVSPDLGTVDEFTFDPQEVLKKNIDFKLKTIGSSAIINDIDNIEFKLHIFEVVLTAGVLVTSYDPDTPSSSFDFLVNFIPSFNWRESHFSLSTFSKYNYRLDGLTKKFLSEAPTTKDIELNANEFLGMAWTESSGGVKNYIIKILTYDSSNALLNTDNLIVSEWNHTIVSSFVDPYLDVPVGTANLIAMGVSLTNVAKYTIQLVSDDGIRSELKTYNIVESCSSDTRIHFVNKFGKQDSITLKGNETETIEYKSTNYTKALSTTYLSSDYGNAIIQNETFKSFTAYSKSIGRDVINFASSMLITKIAWIEVGGKYFSILIEDGSKLIRNNENMPIQFVLNYSLANTEKGHRG
tara:strand:+ start:2371 stop:3588 length:1218 start_codon:yes stop_codon:yes gene_type:complete